MPNTEFTMNELTDAADVSARTVRYYISEGLIPPPAAVGRRASYTSAHLNRLRVIGQLKNAFLPLREIRRQLDGMSDSDVEAMLHQTETPHRSRDPASKPRVAESASSYPDRALHGSSIRQPLPQSRGEQLSIVDSASIQPIDLDELQDPAEIAQLPHRFEQRVASRPARHSPLSEGAVWRRIELGADAELLIREDAYARKRERVEWLINWAKRVFN